MLAKIKASKNKIVCNGKGLYNEEGKPYQGPGIKIGACHCPNNNHKHKRAANNHVNPESIRRSPENIFAIAKFWLR